MASYAQMQQTTVQKRQNVKATSEIYMKYATLIFIENGVHNFRIYNMSTVARWQHFRTDQASAQNEIR